MLEFITGQSAASVTWREGKNKHERGVLMETKYIIILTHDSDELNIINAINKIDNLDSIISKPYLIRVENI